MIDKGHTCWKKMGVLNFIISSLLITVISAREFVPVLLWGTQSLSSTHQTVPGLSRLSTDEFLDYLLKKVKVEKPVIVVFMEENISVEDFSWRDVDENGAFPLVSSITKLASDVSFIPSVLNPYRALKKLKEHGYSWEIYNDAVDTTLQDNEAVILLVKLEEPKYLEDRPDMLRNHDKQMAKVYSKLLKWKSNVLAVYTGHHCSWIDAEVEYNRVKREDAPGDKEDNRNTVVVQDGDKLVILAFTPPIIYTNGDKVSNITEVVGTPTTNKNETYINLDVNFKGDGQGGKFEVDFHFSGREDGNWVLTKATILENKDSALLPSISIGGPRGYSWFCQNDVEFKTTSGTDEAKASLKFKDLQVQPYVKDGRFSSPIDCVPYFSAAIWSGIFVVFLLTIVAAWGIIMIMDINTMDRFDDPKGKTITISATD